MTLSDEKQETSSTTEVWDQTLKGNTLRIWDNGASVGMRHKINLPSNSKSIHGYRCYGSTIVSSGIHEWTIEYRSSSLDAEIGVTSDFSDINLHLRKTKNTFYYKSSKLYGWYSKESKRKTIVSGVTKIKNGNVFKLVLDLQKSTLSYYNPQNSSEPSGVVPNLPETAGWRLTCFSNSSYNEYYKLIKSESKTSVDFLNFLSNIKSGIEYNNKIKNSIKTLDFNGLIKVKKISEINLTNCKMLQNLLVEYSKTTLGIIEAVNKEVKPDITDYQNWGPKEICRFILSLENGEFTEYKEILQKSLIENDLHGTDIKDLTKNDLIPFGITKFGHRAIIYKALMKLTTTKEGLNTELH